MFLAVDIGNTNMTFGLIKDSRIIRKFDIPTAKYTLAKLSVLLKGKKTDSAIICSVVPDAAKSLSRGLLKLVRGPIYITGKNIAVPVKSLYRKPSQLGLDRLVNAYAGIKLYKTPLIIIDFGTAVSFDIVDARARYLGGMILPGPGISLESLSDKTALLPKIKLKMPKEFIGRDTESCIISGIVFGFACLTDGLCRKIKNKIGNNALVIATGGCAPLIKRYCRQIDKLEPDLTLKGLMLIYKNAAVC
ncbi:MAG: type III pantothenate kinase [Candidatus Omnitrophica bacterium]|nr:type III pantothenate kinase [Candidatus Omnitrophota bacterium]